MSSPLFVSLLFLTTLSLAHSLQFSYVSRLETLIGKEINGRLIKDEEVPKFRLTIREVDPVTKLWSFSYAFTNGDFRLYREGNLHIILPGLVSPLEVRICSNTDTILCQNQPYNELKQSNSPFIWHTLRASPQASQAPLIMLYAKSSVIKPIELVPV